MGETDAVENFADDRQRTRDRCCLHKKDTYIIQSAAQALLTGHNKNSPPDAGCLF